jgi:alkanesulfonate monooxygenase SsuD/methylene tetrahydromethanopterin reductase-like flavin-dependent oxidoreductase (luciferase family)
MRYGFVLPSGDARLAADAAAAAEQAGWDGFFVWEPVWGNDAWVSLTAAAMLTERIRLGTMLSPIARMRPWKLASEAASLDNLSGGRVILGIGLGAPDSGYAAFGEVIDRRARAELTDEGLAILTGLWAGQPFSFSGKHYQVRPTEFAPPAPPVQQPRIPIWVVGAHGRAPSMRRAAAYDGLLPTVIDAKGRHTLKLAHMPAILAELRELRGDDAPYEIIVEGETPGGDPRVAAKKVRPWAKAGATWWLETMWSLPRETPPREAIFSRLEQGPPRIE